MGSISGGWRGPGIVGDGLVLYLDAGSPSSYLTEFGTTWKDVSGNGNTGTLTNGPTYDTDSGGSIAFDGVNDYINCGPNLTSSNVFTYSFWIKPTGSTIRTMLGNGSDVGGPQFRVNATNYLEFIKQEIVAIGTSNATITNSVWSFVTITYTGTDYTFYINGLQSGTGSNTQNLVVSATTWIGARSFGALNPIERFVGNIAVALKYNRVLTAAEITQNYNAQANRFITDTDVIAFFARVTTSGGTLSTTEQIAINNLVTSLKANNLWNSLLAIYPMVGSSAAACAQNLKSSSFTGTFSGGWTFASTGATPNGTNAYMNTTYNPSTSGTLNSAHLSVYSRTNIGNNKCFLGGNTTAFASNHQLGSGNGFVALNSATWGNYSPSSYLGLLSISRIASTGIVTYYNGSQLSTFATVSTSLTNANIYLSANNNANVAESYSTNEIALASIGNGLSGADITNFYTVVQAFQTSLSRQV